MSGSGRSTRTASVPSCVDMVHGGAAPIRPAAEAQSHKVAAAGCAALQQNVGCGMRKIKYKRLSMRSFSASYCYQQHLF